jgi:hypothetical protein
VVVKGMMGGGPKKSQDLGSSNLYALLTIQAVLMLLPFAIVFEGPQVRAISGIGSNVGRFEGLKWLSVRPIFDIDLKV